MESVTINRGEQFVGSSERNTVWGCAERLKRREASQGGRSGGVDGANIRVDAVLQGWSG